MSEKAEKIEKVALDQGGLFGLIGGAVNAGSAIALGYNKDYQLTQRSIAEAQAESARQENNQMSNSRMIWIAAIAAIVIIAMILMFK